MIAERAGSRESFFLETLSGLASRSEPKMREAIEEFLQGVQDGKIRIFSKKAVLKRTVSRRWQEHGTANLFLPSEYSPDQAEKEAVSILTDTLTITRGLSGPQLHTMRQFEEGLRKE